MQKKIIGFIFLMVTLSLAAHENYIAFSAGFGWGVMAGEGDRNEYASIYVDDTTKIWEFGIAYGHFFHKTRTVEFGFELAVDGYLHIEDNYDANNYDIPPYTIAPQFLLMAYLHSFRSRVTPYAGIGVAYNINNVAISEEFITTGLSKPAGEEIDDMGYSDTLGGVAMLGLDIDIMRGVLFSVYGKYNYNPGYTIFYFEGEKVAELKNVVKGTGSNAHASINNGFIGIRLIFQL